MNRARWLLWSSMMDLALLWSDGAIFTRKDWIARVRLAVWCWAVGHATLIPGYGYGPFPADEDARKAGE